MELRKKIESCLTCAIQYRTTEVHLVDELTREEVMEIERRGFIIRPDFLSNERKNWLIKSVTI